MIRTFRLVPGQTPVELKDFNHKDLDSLQKEVGGFVQLVSLDGRTDMWCNEEGKLQNLPVNMVATNIWHGVFGPTDIIVGPVIIVVKGTKPTKLGQALIGLLTS